MKTTKYVLSILLSGLVATSFAGNKERIGQAGANELLINPWARSTGFAGANTAYISGVESMSMNIAGLSAVSKTELYYSNVALFSGSGISMNSLALGQRVGGSSVLGISMTSMSFGDLPITTTTNPGGGQGTFRPQFMNIMVAYSRTFSNSIHAGGGIRIISESISNVSAQAVALDAGVRYITGDYDRLKFGIALRNVGPKMNFTGEGLATTVLLQDAEFTLAQRTEGFEMPALLNIGASYDLYIMGVEKPMDAGSEWRPSDYRLTLAGNFTSNSFSPDQIRFGAEFGYKKYLAVRGGLVYESNVFTTLDGGRKTANTGPTFGVSLMLPTKNSDDSGFSLDYAYKFANPLGGTHSIGLRLNL